MDYEALAVSAARSRKAGATGSPMTISDRLSAMRQANSVSSTAATPKHATRATTTAKEAARRPTGPSRDYIKGFSAGRSMQADHLKAALASDAVRGQERAAMKLLAAGKTIAEIEADLRPAVWDAAIAKIERERGQA